MVESWDECQAFVLGEAGARYRAFKTQEDAREWLLSGADYATKKSMPVGVYFDAGTGRGEGVEVKVTDNEGKSLLALLLSKETITQFGTQRLGAGVSNNYGELLACKYAIELAIARGAKHVFGDSKLVLDYWSRGYINVKEVPEATVKLAREVAGLRKAFEAKGGSVLHVSGDENPADLGFH